MLHLPPFRYLLNNAALYAGAVAATALDLDFIDMSGDGVLDPRITFSRASVATYFDSAGVLQTAATNAPRFDHDPVTLAPRGLLVEYTVSNTAWPSEDFTHANYTKTGLTVTANQTTAASGATTADLITASATTATISLAIGVTGGLAYGQSVFAKKGTSDWIYMVGQSIDVPKAWFDLATGSVGTIQAGMTTATIQDVGNGWYRCAFFDVGATGVENLVVGLCDGDNSTVVTIGRTAYLWGAQSEINADGILSSYIPTTTGAVARAVDTVVMTGGDFSSWFNVSAGTFIAEFDVPVTAGTRVIMSADGGSAAEQIRLYGSAANPKVEVRDGGAQQADLDVGTISANTDHKLGVSYALNDIAACVDGGTVATDLAATMPTPTQLRIGWDGVAAANYLNGHIRRIQYFNTAKSDADLAALTA